MKNKIKMKDMNLNALFHFHVIAKHRSLSKASEELHLSAPAVTHSLNNLEAALKETLCIRSRTEFSLTPIGLSLYQTTQKIFQDLENFSEGQVDEAQFNGILSIGVLDHFENTVFEKALCETVKKFPMVKLNIQSYDSEMMNTLLLEREIDLAFGIFSNHSPRIKYQKIGEEKLSYYISKNHPLWPKKKITKEDLNGQKVTWFDNHNRKKSDLELNILVENLKYKMQFYGFTNNLSGALQILLSGHTVVPLSEAYGRTLEKQYKIRKLEIETKERVLSEELAYNPTHSLSVAARFFIEAFTD